MPMGHLTILFKVLVQVFCSFLKLLGVTLFLPGLLAYFIHSRFHPALSEVCLEKISSQSMACLFTLRSLLMNRPFNFDKYILVAVILCP